MYTAWADPEFHERLIRHKVRHAGILLELVTRTSPTVRPSPPPDEPQLATAFSAPATDQI
jgi:hypothetical protein